jgi:hypothetical protein
MPTFVLSSPFSLACETQKALCLTGHLAFIHTNTNIAYYIVIIELRKGKFSLVVSFIRLQFYFIGNGLQLFSDLSSHHSHSWFCFTGNEERASETLRLECHRSGLGRRFFTSLHASYSQHETSRSGAGLLR